MLTLSEWLIVTVARQREILIPSHPIHSICVTHSASFLEALTVTSVLAFPLRRPISSRNTPSSHFQF